MTPFALLCQACGLSHREAADFLGVRPDTIRSWSIGRRQPSAAVITDLRQLWAEIDFAARQSAAAIKEEAAKLPDGEPLEIGYPADDHEAQDLGLPCVGAWRAMCAGVVAAIVSPVNLVPRGSTAASALAIEGRERGL